MSLKVFHVVFVTLAITLALVCAFWSFTNRAPLVFGYASLATAVALAIYGVWFLRKAKKIIT